MNKLIFLQSNEISRANLKYWSIEIINNKIQRTMTIKALHGGKLLCLMAAVAGAMTLGSCKDDDDDPEPTPAPVPVDTTPQKVTFPDEYKFRINNSTPAAFNAGDSIKANTLLSNGANSDTVSIDVILRNNTMVDPSLVSLSLANSYLGSVKISQTPSINDSIYSVSFPAVEGNYSLSINGKTRNFVVASTAKPSANRSLSNKYTAKLDSVNKSIFGMEFVPFSKTQLTSTIAHLKGSGKFITLSDEVYNNYLTSPLSFVKGDITDKLENETTTLLPLNEVKHFAYVAESGNIIICNIADFAGAEVQGATLSVEISY